jgi:diacylglycerol kinase family enzyme
MAADDPAADDEARERRGAAARVGLVDWRPTCGGGVWGSSASGWVERVDAHPRLKSRAGPYYYSWCGVSAFYRKYLHNAVRVRFESGGESAEGVTAIVQNSDPFTYFASRQLRVCEGVEIDDGTLSLRVLKRATQRDMPTLIRRLFSAEKPAARHRQVEHFDDITAATITSVSEGKDGAPRPFPLQVDGDYIGEHTRVELRADPGALTIVA